MLLLLLLLRYIMLLSTKLSNREFLLLIMTQDQKNEVTEQIWLELSDRLRQFVRSRIKSVADVDDVLQSIFLRIHTKFDDLRNAERLESWVFQITRNAISDYYRKKRNGVGGIESYADAFDESNTNADDVHAELADCLRVMIQRLPIDQRRALSMFEFDGISQKEIAAQESISLSGAKSRIQRGRKSLEAMLKACCELQFDRRGNVTEYKARNKNCCHDCP